MFKGLFGSKSDRPAPPKNQIEVECPACGAFQYEPKMVVSTFCKKCGVHLSVERRRVVASNVTRSGMGMPDPWAKTEEPAPKSVSADEPGPPAKAGDGIDEGLRDPVTEEEAAEGGFGVFLKQQLAGSAGEPGHNDGQPDESGENALEKPAGDSARTVEREENEEEETAAPKRPQSNSPPPTPAPPPMNEGTLQKMRDAGLYRNHYFKDAECFECGHKFKVNRSLRSVACANCGATIPMEDVEVNMLSCESIKTRGDVMIRKRGHVRAEGIRCKDLRCFGIIEAEVKAEGDVIIRSTDTISGRIHCRRLIIEKGSDVIFKDEVHAGEIEVHARVSGSLVSLGKLIIGAYGSVDGDVTARSVSIEPGGELHGGMSIVTNQAPAKPAAAESPEGGAS